MSYSSFASQHMAYQRPLVSGTFERKSCWKSWDTLSWRCAEQPLSRRRKIVVAILCLHVDDGFFVTAPNRMSTAQKQINSKFSIKEWQSVSEAGVTFLGVKTYARNGCFVDDMSEYVAKIQPADNTTASEVDLEGAQLSSFRRLIMQLGWPAHLLMPEFIYKVSSLAQTVARAKGRDLEATNVLLASTKKAALHGKATNVLHPVDENPMLVTYFDASLGKTQAMSAQQAEALQRSPLSRPSQVSQVCWNFTVERCTGL